MDKKLKALEIKILTYIDIYNLKYTENDTNTNTNTDTDTDTDTNTDNTKMITCTSIKLEKIGNIERLYQNFNNHTKKLNKQLRYSIHKINILVILDTLQYIINTKNLYFNFNLYSYKLYNVIGLDKDVKNIYVIQKKNKNSNYNFTGSCIMLIFIRDKMFVHYY
jgi:hypothetical protein